MCRRPVRVRETSKRQIRESGDDTKPLLLLRMTALQRRRTCRSLHDTSNRLLLILLVILLLLLLVLLVLLVILLLLLRSDSS